MSVCVFVLVIVLFSVIMETQNSVSFQFTTQNTPKEVCGAMSWRLISDVVSSFLCRVCVCVCVMSVVYRVWCMCFVSHIVWIGRGGAMNVWCYALSLSAHHNSINEINLNYLCASRAVRKSCGRRTCMCVYVCLARARDWTIRILWWKWWVEVFRISCDEKHVSLSLVEFSPSSICVYVCVNGGTHQLLYAFGLTQATSRC